MIGASAQIDELIGPRRIIARIDLQQQRLLDRSPDRSEHLAGLGGIASDSVDPGRDDIGSGAVNDLDIPTGLVDDGHIGLDDAGLVHVQFRKRNRLIQHAAAQRSTQPDRLRPQPVRIEKQCQATGFADRAPQPLGTILLDRDTFEADTGIQVEPVQERRQRRNIQLNQCRPFQLVPLNDDGLLDAG